MDIEIFLHVDEFLLVDQRDGVAQDHHNVCKYQEDQIDSACVKTVELEELGLVEDAEDDDKVKDRHASEQSQCVHVEAVDSVDPELLGFKNFCFRDELFDWLLFIDWRPFDVYIFVY